MSAVPLPLPGWRHWGLVLLSMAAGAAVLLAMGRPAICPCGTVALWHGDVMSAENSQQLTDWYTPSHMLHGLVFYMALRWLTPRMDLGPRLALAALVEVAWEVLENSDVMIERYRAVTVSLGYYGDSVVNSSMDVVAMCAGFLIAARLPVRASVAMFLLAEAVVGMAIRDGLVLNVVMLVWPSPAILAWQAGG